jgi:hypothetical protein
MRGLNPQQDLVRRRALNRKRTRKAAGSRLCTHRANQEQIKSVVISTKELFTELKSLVPPNMQVRIDEALCLLEKIDKCLFKMRPKHLGAVVPNFFDDVSIEYPFPVIEQVIGVEAAPAGAAKDDASAAGEASASAVAISKCVAVLSDSAEVEPSANVVNPRKRKGSESVVINSGEVLSARDMALLKNPAFVAAIKHLANVVV